MSDHAGRLRVVVVSPELPHAQIPHAGGRYVATLVEVLEGSADVVVISPDTPVNRHSLGLAGLPSRHIVIGRRSTRPVWLRPVFRALALMDQARGRRDPSSLSAVLVASLLTSQAGRAALRGADVVDLQWSETARLQPVVRLLNRSARVVGTFHDVRSERFLRSAQREPDPGRRRVLLRASRAETQVQSRLVHRLDVAVTFSDKDAVQLDGGLSPSIVTVVRPPLADLQEVRRERSARPTVVFVGHLARRENEDAVTWLLDEVWPRVREAVPDVALRVVGGGAGSHLTHRMGLDPSVLATGYVEDLAAQYADAWLCVVPVVDGAGVKFKTVEALVAGLPVVTTSIGAEGVAEPSAFAGCTDDAQAFAAACVKVLRDPASAQDHAADVANWARHRFSRADFERTVARIYLSEG